MNLEVTEMENVAVVSVKDSVLQEDAVRFRAVIADLIDKNRCRIVIDMQSTQYISSMCLAAIVSNKKKANRESGDIKLAAINPLIRRLLETTRLLGEIQVFATVGDAVASFRGAAAGKKPAV
jgi:anti-anti-sigma factor